MIQLINDEKFTNIQRAQAGLTRLFLEAKKSLSFYRVMKNDKPLGVLVPEEIWQSWTEDMEALSSPGFRQKIARARSEKKRIPAEKIRKMVGL
jgi:PHD/YefM family antitoxin component YafN of YafNO toxin-antitoxin module